VLQIHEKNGMNKCVYIQEDISESGREIRSVRQVLYETKMEMKFRRVKLFILAIWGRKIRCPEIFTTLNQERF
jgi:hypothetical protein